MANPNIYVIGNHHEDPSGNERLLKLLNYVNPDVVGVEGTKESIKRLCSQHNYLTSKKFVDDLKLKGFSEELISKTIVPFYSGLNFGAWLPLDYAERTGARIIYLEDAKIFHSLARETRPELFGNEFEEKGHYFPNIQERLNALLNKHNGDLTSFQREVDAIYDWCKDPNNAEIIKKRGEKNKNYERDVFATEKIKEVVDNNNTQKIVVVRGAAHILYLQQLLWDVDVDANIQSALLNCDINKNSFYVPKTEITPSCWC